jgi:hypothetical protein
MTKPTEPKLNRWISHHYEPCNLVHWPRRLPRVVSYRRPPVIPFEMHDI